MKNPNYQLIKDQIRQAINQVDENLVVTAIDILEDSTNRHLTIILNIDGKELRVEV